MKAKVKRYIKITAAASAILAIFLYPEAIFPSLAGIFVIAVFLLLVIELGLDIYIVVVYLMEYFREKKKKRRLK